MPCGDYASKERQSVYEKALVVCHEDEKELSSLQQKLDRSRLEKYISYKLEEKELRKELFRIKQEQRNLALEAKQRERENKSIDELAKEMKVKNPGNMAATAIKLEKKFSLPQINCTQNNVPRILKRSLSRESEYFTWTFDLSKVENAVNTLSFAGYQKKRHKNKSGKENEVVNEIANRRQSTAHNIVYNVPVTERAGNVSVQPSNGIKLPPMITETRPTEDRLDKATNKTTRLELPNLQN